MPTVIDQVQFGRTCIAYRIVRRPRQTIAISINPDTTVTVLAPKGMRRSRIREVITTRAAWVVEKQDVVGFQNPRIVRRFVSGEALPYLGRNYQLKITQDRAADGRAVVRMERGRFCLSVRRDWSRKLKLEVVRSGLYRWYRARAIELIAAIAERYGRRLGVRYKAIQIYDMRTRWGSGGTSGTLRFNWRTIMAPKKLVEYVVAHELCHLRHDHHSPEFWRMLATAMPDYDQRRAQLGIDGPAYDL